MSRRRTAVLAVVIAVAVAAVVVGLLLAQNKASSPSAVTLAADPYGHATGAVTVAGTGSPGFSGDGHKAVDAELDAPTGIVENAVGDLFVADTGNCRVREVAARSGDSFGVAVHAGDIATIAGGSCTGPTRHPAPTALALDPRGDLFIAFGSANRVDELPNGDTSVLGGPATAGRPVTIAGAGVAGFAGDRGPSDRSRLDDPTGLAVDPAGDVLIADTANCRLRLVAAADGTRYGTPVVRGHIYTVAGNGACGSAGDGGPAPAAELWDPGALAVDAGGNVLVADQGNRTIRLLAAASGSFYGVAVAADHLGTVAGEGSYGPYLIDGLSAVGETAELNFPTAIALDRSGNLSIADGAMHVIRFVPAVTTTFARQTGAGRRHVHGRRGRVHRAPPQPDGLDPDPDARPGRTGRLPPRAAGLRRQPGRRGAGAAGRLLTPPRRVSPGSR